MSTSKRIKTLTRIDKKFPYYVTILEHSPHFDDTGFNTTILVNQLLIWAFSSEEARHAAEPLVGPMIDPSLIEIQVERIY